MSKVCKALIIMRSSNPYRVRGMWQHITSVKVEQLYAVGAQPGNLNTPLQDYRCCTIRLAASRRKQPCKWVNDADILFKWLLQAVAILSPFLLCLTHSLFYLVSPAGGSIRRAGSSQWRRRHQRQLHWDAESWTIRQWHEFGISLSALPDQQWDRGDPVRLEIQWVQYNNGNDWPNARITRIQNTCLNLTCSSKVVQSFYMFGLRRRKTNFIDFLLHPKKDTTHVTIFF